MCDFQHKTLMRYANEVAAPAINAEWIDAVGQDKLSRRLELMDIRQRSQGAARNRIETAPLWSRDQNQELIKIEAEIVNQRWKKLKFTSHDALSLVLLAGVGPAVDNGGAEVDEEFQCDEWRDVALTSRLAKFLTLTGDTTPELAADLGSGWRQVNPKCGHGAEHWCLCANKDHTMSFPRVKTACDATPNGVSNHLRQGERRSTLFFQALALGAWAPMRALITSMEFGKQSPGYCPFMYCPFMVCIMAGQLDMLKLICTQLTHKDAKTMGVWSQSCTEAAYSAIYEILTTDYPEDSVQLAMVREVGPRAIRILTKYVKGVDLKTFHDGALLPALLCGAAGKSCDLVRVLIDDCGADPNKPSFQQLYGGRFMESWKAVNGIVAMTRDGRNFVGFKFQLPGPGGQWKPSLQEGGRDVYALHCATEPGVAHYLVNQGADVHQVQQVGTKHAPSKLTALQQALRVFSPQSKKIVLCLIYHGGLLKNADSKKELRRYHNDPEVLDAIAKYLQRRKEKGAEEATTSTPGLEEEGDEEEVSLF